MSILFEGVCKIYHGKMVLANISGKINNGEKIGFIGGNGIGKTTFARILAGAEIPDMGSIEYSPHNSLIIYLQQYPDFESGTTVYDELYKAVSKNSDVNEPIDTIVQKSLHQMEIHEDLWEQQATNLSGGEKTKLMLCKVLTRNFDLLILDEPTNHLDIDSATLLEKIIKRIKQSVLIISHNRYLLDRVTDRIWDLTVTGLKSYKGNYSEYKIQKENEVKHTLKEYEKQQKQIEQLNQTIRNRRKWLVSAQKCSDYKNAAKTQASAIKAKEKELARLLKNKIEKPQQIPIPAFDFINKFHVQRNKLSPVIIRAHQLAKAYGSNVVFEDLSFTIGRGEKVALLGENGSGKTSLIKILCGVDRNFQGQLSLDSALRIGYFSQEFEELKAYRTILESVTTVDKSTEDLRTLLACLLFRKDDVYKKIKGLSMGEKSRVAFARLILSGANFLILDEPTNYLDIAAKEKIEEVLEQYAGGILFVSHDIYFVQRIAAKIMLLEHGSLKCYDGNYDYYLRKRKNECIQNTGELDFITIRNRILKLECDLAFIGGKLNDSLGEDEKKSLNEEYMRKARELNECRKLL
ncbi:ribosomal protection-like ABC-F family protein [Desulforamulus aeronauticus]|uniref:Macrolide transport system ATP-binding/permease protein n=1 Tax=Desulforamulus aeronauticus DSM 10349 TaxID=1121421 RepID=A0A1M6UYC4_9FIRM|nr:ABC-F family ATP-binding cassette domain-containing protein [Desulforamulus aeronauticus]SHK74095.1 macrolide transport system ATP-binding/permease protein [Desulforamulus aeronauticus DSM 10349]